MKYMFSQSHQLRASTAVDRAPSALQQRIELCWRVALGVPLMAAPMYLAFGTAQDWIKWGVYALMTVLCHTLERRGKGSSSLQAYFVGCLLLGGWFSLDTQGFSARFGLGALGYGVLSSFILVGASSMFGTRGLLHTLPLSLLLLLPHLSDRTWVFAAFVQTAGALLGLELHRLNRRLDRASTQLERLALRDSLTRLGNRQAMNRYFEGLERAQRETLSLTVWDLNDLKLINDRQGHAAGDAYILRFAEVLHRCSSEEHRFFRTGGDEFVGLHPAHEARRMLERVQRLFPSVAAGHAELEGDLEGAFSRADALLYAEKRRMKLHTPDERMGLILDSPPPTRLRLPPSSRAS